MPQELLPRLDPDSSIEVSEHRVDDKTTTHPLSVRHPRSLGDLSGSRRRGDQCRIGNSGRTVLSSLNHSLYSLVNPCAHEDCDLAARLVTRHFGNGLLLKLASPLPWPS